MEFNTKVKDVIENYGKKSAFSSFLPGIAGIKGTPMWAYYVNRGQAIVSFGVQDKDHGIMEFYPAHTAYQMVSRTGFRTFLKVDGKYQEAFKEATAAQKMTVYMNALSLEDTLEDVSVKVSYTTLPGEEIASLMRVVEIKNIRDSKIKLEVLDGMPALVPYGVGQDSLKMMMQTTKAWMQVEDVETGCPYYRVRVSMEDSAVVKKIDGGNFATARLASGEALPAIVDPSVVFDYDLSLANAQGFMDTDVDTLLKKHQITSNEMPCAFFATTKELEAGEAITLYELIGQVRNKDILNRFLEKKIDGEYFEAKFEEAVALTEDLTKAVSTTTGNETFDNYCRYNYMDNVLRGGTPITIGGKHVFYVYSRKHGDLERDYNYFSMSPEFYSQGNGNFRDVNQNRRCDTFFSSIVNKKNIEMFYGLLQLDGYNPLKIEQMKYQIDGGEPFTPGELVASIMDKSHGQFGEKEQAEFEELMSKATETSNGDFGEGYWSDHWTYNLDLIEDYLEVYPDKEKELLFDTKVKTFGTAVKVKPRFARYEVTENGVRQYHYLEKNTKTVGGEVEMSLMAKLILLSTVKVATLDPYGLGVEMEGGKPGWYDALNGMPGLFGSSMNESYELNRMVKFAIKKLENFDGEIAFPAEVAEFIMDIAYIEKQKLDAFESWNRKNDIKEDYRATVYEGLSGETKILTAATLLAAIRAFEATLDEGVKKALELGDGIAPAYFTFEMDDYQETEKGIVPKHFKLVQVPHFLEGPVRYLKLDATTEQKEALYSKVKNSDLYDTKLSMYKVNESLQDASFELGRCRAFTPGWLENESIWMHMEYKYLLELLRSGLYSQFFEDFKNAAIPFLDKDTYGRSTLENSSFIASSKNPNEKIHGRGFVARLSGSTIEFISIWKLMFFGKDLFKTDDEGKLVFNPTPAIPKYLLKKKGTSGNYTVKVTMLGTTELVYEMTKEADYIPGQYVITDITVEYEDESLTGVLPEKIRDRQAKKVTIKMTPK
ncbi:MAG: hypothetical protein IKP29_07490 [Pseudobutyrivibrio sp.]|nr:hypothetical protein [Pseudobutyrivibrio sp.]